MAVKRTDFVLYLFGVCRVLTVDIQPSSELKEIIHVHTTFKFFHSSLHFIDLDECMFFSPGRVD